MNQEIQREIDALKREINELKQKQNQLRIPIDVITQATIRQDLPVYKSKTSGAVSVGGYITTEINGLEVNILIK